MAAPIRVLIAEPDPRARFALQTFLNAHPHIVVVAEAEAPAAALVLARAHAPTVAIVDLPAPIRAERLSLVRTLSGRLEIPVIAIGLEYDVRESALTAGAIRFLEKAEVPDRLVDALTIAARAAGARHRVKCHSRRLPDVAGGVA